MTYASIQKIVTSFLINNQVPQQDLWERKQFQTLTAPLHETTHSAMCSSRDEIFTVSLFFIMFTWKSHPMWAACVGRTGQLAHKFSN